MAEGQQRHRSQPAGDARPFGVEGAGRDAVELGHHPGEVGDGVAQDRPGHTRHRPGGSVAATVEVEHPADDPEEDVVALPPPGDVAELHQAGQLGIGVAEAPELLGQGVEAFRHQ